MAYKYKFEKILSIKEREKDEAVNIYNQAVKRFEEAAQRLYDLLKQKESAEAIQERKLITGLSVQEIRHNQLFVENLKKVIDHQQQIVINTRNQMNFFQEKLKEKNIEVKKYEKIREKDFENYQLVEKFEDNKQMDEISLQQFMSKGN